MFSDKDKQPATDRPLIVQSDRTVLLEVDHPLHEEARDALLHFAELVKSPEHIHTYRLSPISLWNAASAGLGAPDVLDTLEKYSRFDIPQTITELIRGQMGRYGLLRLFKDEEGYYLECDEPTVITQFEHNSKIARYFAARISTDKVRVKDYARGLLKSALIQIGFPVEDLAGYVTGEPLPINLRDKMLGDGQPFVVRDYQAAAAEAFHRSGSVRGGSGVVVLPCGSGKTVVGIKAMSLVGTRTLILVTNITAARQWRDELLNKTDLKPDDIGEYSGSSKEIKPVTIATYQIVVWRPDKKGPFPHFGLFTEENWGLIVYDEVHLLPAPVFRVTAEIQARRRLGLTATLVREDGKEGEVFSLIGPKRYDAPWKEIEKKNWIATASCTEIRVGMPTDERIRYASSTNHKRFRVAAENPTKQPVIEKLLGKHEGALVLIIGHYIKQLQAIAEKLDVPLITGQTPQAVRDEVYDKFRRGEIRTLVVSKVANFALDLPDANVAIQVSGTFGSRQEEAQRLGRILRPKSGENVAHFYTVVSRDTVEQDYAMHRELFLTEQGYSYTIADAEAYFVEEYK